MLTRKGNGPSVCFDTKSEAGNNGIVCPREHCSTQTVGKAVKNRLVAEKKRAAPYNRNNEKMENIMLVHWNDRLRLEKKGCGHWDTLEVAARGQCEEHVKGEDRDRQRKTLFSSRVDTHT